MTTITTHDGIEIFYKDWGSKDAQPIVFHHGWPLTPTIGIPRFFTSYLRAIESSRTTAVDTAARRRSAMVMTWITTRRTPPRLLSILISGMPCT